MTELDLLKLINVSPEQMTEYVVDAVADKVLSTRGWTDDDGDVTIDTRTKEQLQKLVKSTITQHIDAVFEQVIAPNLKQLIDTCILQKTNSWGESTGKAVTFTEYLVACVENYAAEQVDSSGKSKAASKDCYWHANGTRLTHLIETYLTDRMHTAITTALKQFNETLADGLAETVKQQLKATLDSLKLKLVC